MKEGNGSGVVEPVGNAEVLKFGAVESARSILDQIVRGGARKMLQPALEDEVNAFLEQHASKVDSEGRRISTSMYAWKTRKIKGSAFS